MIPGWLPLLLVCGQVPGSSADELPGFRRAGTSRVFTGTGLYGHIDGGAEIFLELGFERLVVQEYQKNGHAFTVELYTMTDQAAALGIYLMKCGQEKRNAALKARHTLGRRQIMFQRSRIFALVYHKGDATERSEDLVELAKALTSRMPEDVAVSQLALLPSEGRVEGSLRLIRGPFGLHAIYSLGEGDVLLLKDRVTAVAADYRGPGGNHTTRILVPYPTGQAARDAFRHLRDHLDPYLKVGQKTTGCIAFEDFKKKFGVIRLQGKRLDIRVNLIGKKPCTE
jgi:hypothetical protein